MIVAIPGVSGRIQSHPRQTLLSPFCFVRALVSGECASNMLCTVIKTLQEDLYLRSKHVRNSEAAEDLNSIP
jgi:hypothetical protein